MRKVTSEALGTFILVFGGCGTAVLAAKFPGAGVGLLGVSLAFGLSLLAALYALGPISGGHFNPAVSLGLACAGRFSFGKLFAYVGAQLFGAILAAGVLAVLAGGQPGGYDPSVQGLAANGFGEHSPGQFSLVAGLLAELALTFVFLTVILGATAKAATETHAGIAIGLSLTVVHLVGIPITNVSVNPARSTGPALFVGGWALKQLWLFWLAPLAGAALAGGLARWLHAETPKAVEARDEAQRGKFIPGAPLAAT